MAESIYIVLYELHMNFKKVMKQESIDVTFGLNIGRKRERAIAASVIQGRRII
jgi:hypothetical protein